MKNKNRFKFFDNNSGESIEDCCLKDSSVKRNDLCEVYWEIGDYKYYTSGFCADLQEDGIYLCSNICLYDGRIILSGNKTLIISDFIKVLKRSTINLEELFINNQAL